MQKHTEELTRQTVLLGKTDIAKARRLMNQYDMSLSAIVRLAIDTLDKIKTSNKPPTKETK